MVAASLAGDRLVAKTVLDSPRWEVCRRPTALLRLLLSESRTKEMMQPCLIYLHVISLSSPPSSRDTTLGGSAAKTHTTVWLQAYTWQRCLALSGRTGLQFGEDCADMH